MDNRILCIINPFVAKQRINIYNNGENNLMDVDMADLGTKITELCYANNIFNVILKTMSCPKDFAEVVFENINEAESSKYSENKIIVEVY